MLNFSQNAQGVYVRRGVVFWPVSSLSNATVTLYPTHSAFTASIGGGYLTSLAYVNN